MGSLHQHFGHASAAPPNKPNPDSQAHFGRRQPPGSLGHDHPENARIQFIISLNAFTDLIESVVRRLNEAGPLTQELSRALAPRVVLLVHALARPGAILRFVRIKCQAVLIVANYFVTAVKNEFFDVLKVFDAEVRRVAHVGYECCGDACLEVMHDYFGFTFH